MDAWRVEAPEAHMLAEPINSRLVASLGRGGAHSGCTHIFHLLQRGMGRALKMGDVSRCQSLGWGVRAFLKCPLHFGGCFRNISLTSPPFPPRPSSRYWKVHQHPGGALPAADILAGGPAVLARPPLPRRRHFPRLCDFLPGVLQGFPQPPGAARVSYH